MEFILIHFIYSDHSITQNYKNIKMRKKIMQYYYITKNV